MTGEEISNKIQAAIDAAKKDGWEILHPDSPTWFRWRNGRAPPAATVLGALLMARMKNEAGNFPIPDPTYWFAIITEYLGVPARWMSIFSCALSNSNEWKEGCRGPLLPGELEIFSKNSSPFTVSTAMKMGFEFRGKTDGS